MSSIKELETLLTRMPQRGGELVPAGAAGRRIGNNVSLAGHFDLDTRGVVRGAWQKGSQDAMPKEIFYLPDGVSHALPEGSAIAVLSYLQGSEAHWTTFQVPAGGEIAGPMIWGGVEAAPEAALVISRTKEEHQKSAMVISLLMAAMTMVLSLGFGALAAARGGVFMFLLVAMIGCILAVSVVIGGPSALADLLGRREKRRAADLDVKVADEHVQMPDGAKAMIEKLPLPEPKAEVADTELLQAIRSYRAAKEELDGWDGGDRGDKAMIRHTSVMLEEIASRLISAEHLADGGDLRQSFMDLLSRAEGDVRRVLGAQRAQEQSSVMGDIDALNAQLDRHFGAKGA
jgi:hypothetical protein